MALAQTPSIISDLIWPGRSAHLAEMAKFGIKSDFHQFDIVSGQQATVKNLLINIHPSEFKAARASGTDLRGTMALLLIAAAVNGTSKIDNPSFALRGYPDLLENFRRLGLEIEASDAGHSIPSLPEI